MMPFVYRRASSVDDAIAAAADPQTRFIGGGTNLLDLMKSGIERPTHLIDVNHLALDRVEATANGLRIGAGARNSDVANHELVRRRYPLLSRALLAGASPQLRNMATVGGNLMQRTRCDYFVDTGFDHCNKRKPGSGCAALTGHHRLHAVLGASSQCIAVNPSDMSVALVALDATVNVRGPGGSRAIAIGDFHRLPGDRPERDTTLKPDELIVSVDLPARADTLHWEYLKIRDRASFAFALVSAAVSLDVADGTIGHARIALGGVAHRPWFAQQASNALIGKRVAEIDTAAIGALAIAGARPLKDNAFKLVLARNTVARALTQAIAA